MIATVARRASATVSAPGPALHCVDWRVLSAEDVHPLLAQERAAWRRDLAWDIREAWRPVEVARAGGTLPGFAALDARGRIVGWTWFIDRDGVRQVGALVARSSEATRALVAALDGGHGASVPGRQVVSVRAAAPELAAVLSAHGFRTTTYRYLCRALDQDGVFDGVEFEAPRPLRTWQAEDVEPLARLCARAYARSTDVRAFAPGGRPSEWRTYAANLADTPGCGRLVPEATLVSAGPQGLHAAIVTTDLGLGTAHIAQIAVDPSERRAGVGRALLDAAVVELTGLGFERLTLLVADSNAPARRLYDRAGFVPRAAFLVAAR